MSIEQIYDIKSAQAKNGFISTYTLEKDIEKQTDKLKTLIEDVCVLICPNKVLTKTITPWKSFQSQNESTMMNNIIDFLGEIKANANNLDSNLNFYLYSFTNKVTEIQMNSSENEIKNKLLSSISPECDILLSLSELFNELNKKNSLNYPEQKGRFLRIIIFTPQFNKSITAKEIKNVLSSFISSNRNYTSVTCNFLFMEFDSYFSRIRNEQDFIELTDTNPSSFDASLQETSKEIEFLLALYQNKRYYLENIAKKISDIIKQSTTNTDLLGFIKEFDTKFSVIKETHDAIIKEMNTMTRLTTREAQKEIIRAKINDEVLSSGLTGIVCKDIKTLLNEKIGSGIIGEWLTEAKKDNRSLFDDISSAKEDLVSVEIKNSDYWEKKIQFLEEEANVFGVIIKRVENLLEFVDYVEQKMNDDANLIINIK